jgi:hypothetical protein
MNLTATAVGWPLMLVESCILPNHGQEALGDR